MNRALPKFPWPNALSMALTVLPSETTLLWRLLCGIWSQRSTATLHCPRFSHWSMATLKLTQSGLSSRLSWRIFVGDSYWKKKSGPCLRSCQWIPTFSRTTGKKWDRPVAPPREVREWPVPSADPAGLAEQCLRRSHVGMAHDNSWPPRVSFHLGLLSISVYQFCQ